MAASIVFRKGKKGLLLLLTSLVGRSNCTRQRLPPPSLSYKSHSPSQVPRRDNGAADTALNHRNLPLFLRPMNKRGVKIATRVEEKKEEGERGKLRQF